MIAALLGIPVPLPTGIKVPDYIGIPLTIIVVLPAIAGIIISIRKRK